MLTSHIFLNYTQSIFYEKYILKCCQDKSFHKYSQSSLSYPVWDGNHSGSFSAYFKVKFSAALLNFFLSFTYSSAKSVLSICLRSGSISNPAKALITCSNRLPSLLEQ